MSRLTDAIIFREKELNGTPRMFPATKLHGGTLDIYTPPKNSLTAGLFSPWPLKLGEPTLSVLRFHNQSCSAIGGFDGPCVCPRWKAYLRAELRKGGGL